MQSKRLQVREAKTTPGKSSSGISLVFAVVLAAVLGMLWAGSAAAQSSSEQYESGDAPSGLMIQVTGTLERLDPATYGYGEYKITDRESGALYALEDGDEGLLEPYVGQRVTVTGTEPGAGDAPQNPRLLNVMWVKAAGAVRETPPMPEELGTITFEVDTEGVVPQGTKFFGVYGEPTDPYGEILPFGQLGMVSLHDSDGDGTYVGVSDVPQGESLALIAQGNASGPESRIHPQSIVQRDSTITVNGDEIISTTVSFPGQQTEPVSPTDPGTEQYAPDNSSSTSSANVVNDTNGEASARPSGTDEVDIKVLPDTGGVSPLLIAASGLALLSLVLAGIATAGLRAARRR